MANSFGGDILLQAPDPTEAARVYVEQLGFTIDAETPELVSLHGPAINLFIERGPALGPILEVLVDDVEAAKVGETELLAHLRSQRSPASAAQFGFFLSCGPGPGCGPAAGCGGAAG